MYTIDNFDSYTTGQPLENFGGWATVGSGTIYVDNTLPYQGANGASTVSGGSPSYQKALPTALNGASGRYSAYYRQTNNDADVSALFLTDSVLFSPTIDVDNSTPGSPLFSLVYGTLINIVSGSDNTWYRASIDVDYVNTRVRGGINETFCAWQTMTTTPTSFKIGMAGGLFFSVSGTHYWDYMTFSPFADPILLIGN